MTESLTMPMVALALADVEEMRRTDYAFLSNTWRKVESSASIAGGVSISNGCGEASQTMNYSYDALSRPVSRNEDNFAYNDRSEVVEATIAGNAEVHEYDFIGNSTLAAFNSLTNSYAANSLNQ